MRLSSPACTAATRSCARRTCDGINVSVWQNHPTLHAFVYRSPHGAYVPRRSRWHLPTPQPSTAQRRVTLGRPPTLEQACAVYTDCQPKARHLRPPPSVAGSTSRASPRPGSRFQPTLMPELALACLAREHGRATRGS
jgi:hypothetical protein